MRTSSSWIISPPVDRAGDRLARPVKSHRGVTRKLQSWWL
jgi:hypothetical protein